VILSVAAAVETVQPRSRPKAVDPGPQAGVPSDAVVLFDGKDLSRWRHQGGGDAAWTIENGELIAGKAGDLWTRDAFGDVQLHFEWNVPLEEGRQGESRGNSGVKLHGAYEIQILDSFGDEKSSPGGLAGAVYKQHPPLVNACRKPGEWQSYDIVFRAPRFDAEGTLQRYGRFTVFQNGVLVQDHAKFQARTNSSAPPPKDLRQPFFLQWHGSAVRFRNIWVRELDPKDDD
jgi:hypothetical protein